jgi:hypothetical protein
MNLGAERASAPWLWFVNAGDVILSSGIIAKAAMIAQSNTQVSMIATPVVYLTPTNHYYSLSVPRIMQTNSGNYALFHHQGCLLNRSIFQQSGGFDETFSLAADGKLLDSMIAIAPPIIDPNVFVGFEMGGATSRNFWHALKEMRTYRNQAMTNLNMIVYQSKETLRGLFLKSLRKPIGEYLLRSFLIRREKAVIEQATSWGFNLPQKSEFDVH